MNIQNGTEQGKNEQRTRAELDKRYGDIGISAVAGALKHQACEKPGKKDREIVPIDCD